MPDGGRPNGMSRMLSSRRMAYIGAVLIIGLSACGSATNVSSPAGTSPAGSPPVIQVDGGSANAAGSAAVPAAADSASSESTKMMAGAVTYVYDGELTDMTAPAASWFFAPGVDPTTEQIAALAAALGVEGDVQQSAADMGGGWMVGPDDYQQPAVNVGADAMQSWWYSPGNTAVVTPSCELYPPGDPAGDFDTTKPAAAPDTAVVDEPATTMPVCAEPTPPANVPDKPAAEAKARDFFASLGLDASSYQYDSYADEWGASVTGYLVLEGIRTPMTISVGYGAEGAITWASGFLATPQRGADYPRIGVESAVQRLNDQSASWMNLDTSVMRNSGSGVATAGSSGAATDAVAPPDVAQSSGPASVPATGASTDLVVEPMPAVAPEPIVDPAEGVCLEGAATDCAPTNVEPITVTLTNAHPSLEQLWASDDTVWLLPGYAFDAADGGQYSVIAVEDKYIEVTQPAEVPVPETALPVVDPGQDPAAPPATLNLDEVTTALVGLQVDEATKVAEEHGWTLRVVKVDGVDQVVTADFSASRVDVATDAGVVTSIVTFG